MAPAATFKPDPVPGEVLLRAFSAARFAPQGGNRQPVRWIVVRDAAKKQQLKEWYLQPWKAYLAAAQEGEIRIGAMNKLLYDADHFAEHLDEIPVLAVVCAELSEIHPTDHELGRLSVVGGGSIYPTVQNFLLACRAEGLGTALTTLLCHFEPQVRDLLGIPEGIITAGTVAVGYPAKPFPKRLARRPVEEVVFLDRYVERLAGEMANFVLED